MDLLQHFKKFRKNSHKAKQMKKGPLILVRFCMLCQQAGTGPSRRHIQGSKIAKRLPSVKYSFTVLENRKFFEKKFTYSKTLKSHNAEKLKGGTL